MSYTIIAKSTKTVDVYRLDEGFYVEVSTSESSDFAEYYLCHHDLAVKEFMFGIPSDSDLRPEELILGNAADYIDAFIEQYMKD